MKKEKNFWVRNYRACWEFLKESSDYHIAALGIFCVFIIIGFAFPIFFQEQIFAFMQELLSTIENFNVSELTSFIFFNNIKTAFFAMVLGIFVVFPAGAMVVNGYLLGFVARFAVDEAGSILVLWKLVPHGIFELPAVILSVGLGLKIGVEIWRKNSWKILKRNFKEGLRFFIFVIFPLLLVAAVIEGFLIWGLG
ncbi:hypothetical protein CMI37_07745 [Candidatus Pacearchaeota archaeon]|nr:hypothetical protein [Candidatus Pacearchaeota archaeon]|tara:strand:- start:1371 stop:1955 length:585 start_codon:yes stop_codon:yes gene_type:complete